jgi:hypothetical protein
MQLATLLRFTAAATIFSAGCFVCPKQACAQSNEGTFDQLVEKHATVYVMDADGRQFSGRLVRVDPSSFTIGMPEGEQSFQFDRVATIHRRGDSVASGAGIGAVAGAGLGLGLTKAWGCGALLTGYEVCSAKHYALATAMMGGIGAGIGIAVDALVHGRTEIYPRRATHRSSAMTVVPAIGPHHASVFLATRW